MYMLYTFNLDDIISASAADSRSMDRAAYLPPLWELLYLPTVSAPAFPFARRASTTGLLTGLTNSFLPAWFQRAG